MKPGKVQSPHLALVIQKDRPQIPYLGVESGGRGRGHLDHNLLRPGYGGEILPGFQLSSTKDANGVYTYKADSVECQVSFPEERTFRLNFGSKERSLNGTIFRLSFAPDITPPSLWARPQNGIDHQTHWLQIHSIHSLFHGYSLCPG